MFKWINEIKTYHSNKRDIARYSAFLLGEVAELVMKYKIEQAKANDVAEKTDMSTDELVGLVNTIKGMDQKEMLGVIVDFMKSKEGK